MKTRKIQCFFSFLLIVLFSCSSDPLDLENNIGAQLVNASGAFTRTLDENLDYFSFSFPKGTSIVESSNEINFVLPEGYIAYGVDSNKIFSSFTEGRVTRIHTTQKEKPFEYADSNGEGAIQSISSASGLAFVEMGIFNTEEPLRFFESPTELNGNFLLPASFYNLDIIQKVLVEIQDNLITSEVSETKIVALSIFGYVVFVEVAADIDTVSPYMLASAVRCGCTDGSSYLKNKALLAVHCDSYNCESSVLATGIYDGQTLQKYALEAREHYLNVF